MNYPTLMLRIEHGLPNSSNLLPNSSNSKDTLRKLTTHLAKNHGTVAIEDLNVSGMMANRGLSKAVQDMGFYGFRRQLDDKTKLYGSSLVMVDVMVDRWFPSSKTCSCSGRKKDTLCFSERVFECGHCGFQIDRDLNTALNLRSAASPVVSACRADEADFAAMKQEVSRLSAIPSELQQSFVK